MEEETINYVDDCVDIRKWSLGVVNRVIREKKESLERVGMRIDEKKMETCIFRRRRKDQKEELLDGTKKTID